ncbi:MAG: HAMP domain-containing histidine kinase [Ectothiorhodospiraceae bacterium]|nr:HAMP domain-containing histidine kinase [Chromatiales bacterium]MCP5154864.1 HAMP domain-containing histidine kinase [Ectothiorhodospiraceae bacterium]
MTRRALAGSGRARLRLWLALFFLAVAVPAAALVYQAYDRLKWEALHLHRTLAEELARRVDDRASELIASEASYGFDAYAFLIRAGEPGTSFVQRSPLAGWPVESAVPGLIGRFQVDADGVLTTPLLPARADDVLAYGVSASERDARLASVRRIERILADNRLVDGRSRAPRAVEEEAPQAERREQAIAPLFREKSATARQDESIATERRSGAGASAFSPRRPAGNVLSYADPGAPTTPPAQAAFDRLTVESTTRIGKERRTVAAPSLDSDRLADRALGMATESAAKRQLGTGDATPAGGGVAAEAAPPDPPAAAPLADGRRIQTFDGAVEPFEMSRLDGGHLVLFRRVWRDGTRFIQGALVDRDAFVSGLVEPLWRGSALAASTRLAVSWEGRQVAAYANQVGGRYPSSDAGLVGTVLYRTRLTAPLEDLELMLTVGRLPPAPGAGVVAWTAAALGCVLLGGVALMYRLGTRQLALAHQQQDFVSAVSHELRTPLTSIRMYAEMLREGWADEDSARRYYAFIHDEAERLSRLIDNVLRLARLTRNEPELELGAVTVDELIDEIRSKVSSQVERAGFELRVSVDPSARGRALRVDRDAFAQVVINLVDNAIKFAARAEVKRVEIDCRREGDDRVAIAVRDHGPGVARDQMRSIFRLFYRPGNELTRETPGTGIGLALVRELATAMGAKVDVANATPGAVFTVRFPSSTTGRPAGGAA